MSQALVAGKVYNFQTAFKPTQAFSWFSKGGESKLLVQSAYFS